MAQALHVRQRASVEILEQQRVGEDLRVQVKKVLLNFVFLNSHNA
jgi:hypothetical protein